MASLPSHSILDLPRNALDNVFLLTDDKSLLRMRKVCKIAKQKIDSCLLNVRKTELSFGFENGGGHVRFFFNFVEDTDKYWWKLVLTQAMTLLNIGEFEFCKDPLQIIMKTDKMDTFIDYLQSITAKVRIRDTTLIQANSETIEKCSSFCAGSQSMVIFEGIDERNFSSLLDFIKRVNSNYIHCNNELNIDTVNLLLDAAEFVQQIVLDSVNKQQWNNNIFSIIRMILSRKTCKRVGLGDAYILSKWDVQNLLKFCNSRDKKISFTGHSNEALHDSQIGAYQVVYFQNCFDVEHFDFI